MNPKERKNKLIKIRVNEIAQYSQKVYINNDRLVF